MTSAGEGVGKVAPSHLPVQRWETAWQLPKKLNGVTIRPSMSTPRCMPRKRLKTNVQTKTCSQQLIAALLTVAKPPVTT